MKVQLDMYAVLWNYADIIAEENIKSPLSTNTEFSFETCYHFESELCHWKNKYWNNSNHIYLHDYYLHLVWLVQS